MRDLLSCLAGIFRPHLRKVGYNALLGHFFFNKILPNIFTVYSTYNNYFTILQGRIPPGSKSPCLAQGDKHKKKETTETKELETTHTVNKND